jgi:hypothetical protein
MHTLRDLQAGFAQAVRAGASTAIEGAVVADGIGAAGRIAVYRNHFLISLTDALAAGYPVVARLVGDAFFRAATRRYVQERPPRSPCVAEYGEEFPDFLENLPEALGLPYIGDVARLEWALICAAEAADPRPVAADRLAMLVPDRLATARLTLHPSVRLLASPFPIDRIWKANQGCGVPPVVALSEGGACLLVFRAAAEVGWVALPRPVFDGVSALARGQTIEQAGARHGDGDPGSDAIPAFVMLLTNGLITDVSLSATEECMP